MRVGIGLSIHGTTIACRFVDSERPDPHQAAGPPTTATSLGINAPRNPSNNGNLYSAIRQKASKYSQTEECGRESAALSRISALCPKPPVMDGGFSEMQYSSSGRSRGISPTRTTASFAVSAI